MIDKLANGIPQLKALIILVGYKTYTVQSQAAK